MLATVIICTHNRARFLGRCLDALLPSLPAVPGFEIIVVANACSDDTAARVRERTRGDDSRLRLLEEPRPGLSVARNAGAAAAQGRFHVYLDDDAIPTPGWMEAYRDYFLAHPDIAAGGGPIDPDWAGLERPSYWRPEFEVNRARVELPPGVEEFTGESLPFGANMFIRAEVFRELGGFDPDLGMKGRSIGLAEETEWFLRLRRANRPIGYAAGARVSHWVNPRDTTRWGLVRRAYVAGVIGVRVFEVRRPPQGWSGWLRHALSTCIKGRLNMGELVYITLEFGRLVEWSRSRPAQTSAETAGAGRINP